MRTTNSVKNAIISIVMSLINIVVGFIAQRIFIANLGTEYLGLNGLFNNILSILSVAELGFGTAIIYNLYKPVAENDYKKINVLLNFYKKAYRIIAVVILTLGLCIMPFLNIIVGETSISNIHLLFVLALLDVVFSYLLTYKRSILYANQKNYITNIIHIFYILLLNIFQIFLLITTKNFIAYLIVKIIFRVLENVVINIVAGKMYTYINDKTNDPLDYNTKKDIHKKIKGLLYHNIGSALVQGTDNIIISKMFGIVVVGLYSNYCLIINSLNNLLTQLFQSLTSSVGNLLVENNHNKSYNVYKKMLLMNSWIYCITGGCLLCVIDLFITIWIGKEYTLSLFFLIILVLNYYIQGMRKTISVFKNASGIFYEDRFMPVIESVINLVFSIILGKIFGLPGIIIGTILSSMALYLYSYPVLVYKKIFNKKYSQFFKDFLSHFCITLISITITFVVTKNIMVDNLIVLMIIKFLTSFILLNVIYILIFRKTEEFNYYKNIIKNILIKK